MWQDLIDRVTSYVLWKMHKQYDLVKKAIETKSLIACIDVYIATINLSYAYQIRTRIKKIKNKLEQISIEDVHYYWRFDKGHSSSIARLKINFVAIKKTLTM